MVTQRQRTVETHGYVNECFTSEGVKDAMFFEITYGVFRSRIIVVWVPLEEAQFYRNYLKRRVYFRYDLETNELLGMWAA